MTDSPKVVEPTIFELSAPGRLGVTFPASDVPAAGLPPQGLLRPDLPLPELAEVDVLRHYMRLSSFNYSVDSGFYPLGSCSASLGAVLARTEAEAMLRDFWSPLTREVRGMSVSGLRRKSVSR